MEYKVLATGSSGNATLIDGHILVDCGLSIKALSLYHSFIDLVFLTHIHSDHFNKSLITFLSKTYPSIKFCCCSWMVLPLIKCGVSQKQINVMSPYKWYKAKDIKVSPVLLNHNVPNCGWKIILPSGEKVIYATDTNDMNGVKAVGYNLYLIESNYNDDEIKERIRKKEIAGEYAYEKMVLLNHLSEQKALDWLYKNMRENSQYCLMHGHQEKEKTNGEDSKG